MQQDLRYAVRVLLKNPGFTAVALIALALGIGANTAIFTVIDRILLRPLPYRDAGRLVNVVRRFPNGEGGSASIPKFNIWKTASTLENVSAFDFAGAGMNLSGNGMPEQVKAGEDHSRFPGLFPALRSAAGSGPHLHA
jgi:hypothetical protein